MSEALIHTLGKTGPVWNNITAGHHVNLIPHVLDMNTPARVLLIMWNSTACRSTLPRLFQMRGIDMVATKYCNLGISCVPWRQTADHPIQPLPYCHGEAGWCCPNHSSFWLEPQSQALAQTTTMWPHDIGDQWFMMAMTMSMTPHNAPLHLGTSLVVAGRWQ